MTLPTALCRARALEAEAWGTQTQAGVDFVGVGDFALYGPLSFVYMYARLVINDHTLPNLDCHPPFPHTHTRTYADWVLNWVEYLGCVPKRCVHVTYAYMYVYIYIYNTSPLTHPLNAYAPLRPSYV